MDGRSFDSIDLCSKKGKNYNENYSNQIEVSLNFNTKGTDWTEVFKTSGKFSNQEVLE